ncbi:hypothetical protein E0H73_28655 [Kribbella pittospori]|uniref:Uncharacterized protein n=1 Tax=Kribbella pittospori TaxID=722689 RepID=A0A4R0KI16_9ACTN|nr:hypothetical protein E0H73_28655 [Kribbella pittospori]
MAVWLWSSEGALWLLEVPVGASAFTGVPVVPGEGVTEVAVAGGEPGAVAAAGAGADAGAGVGAGVTWGRGVRVVGFRPAWLARLVVASWPRLWAPVTPLARSTPWMPEPTQLSSMDWT